MDEPELLDLARRCVQEDYPVFEFAYALARARGVSVGRVLFGVCHDEGETRRALKLAEMRATRPPG